MNMKRSELDELEGKMLERSMRINVSASSESEEMDEHIQAVVLTLTPEQQERAHRLWDELVDLKVRPGLRNRLMGMGHMGALNDPIWKYIYKLRTGGMRIVKDKGGWLIKCLLNHKLTNASYNTKTN